MDAFWKARGANIIRNNFYEIIKEFFLLQKKSNSFKKSTECQMCSKYCSWHYLAAVQYGKYQIRKGQNSVSIISTLHLANDMDSI